MMSCVNIMPRRALRMSLNIEPRESMITFNMDKILSCHALILARGAVHVVLPRPRLAGLVSLYALRLPIGRGRSGHRRRGRVVLRGGGVVHLEVQQGVVGHAPAAVRPGVDAGEMRQEDVLQVVDLVGLQVVELHQEVGVEAVQHAADDLAARLAVVGGGDGGSGPDAGRGKGGQGKGGEGGAEAEARPAQARRGGVVGRLQLPRVAGKEGVLDATGATRHGAG